MKTSLPPRGEIAARGRRVYQERLRQLLEPAHNGMYAVINIDTGEYELDVDHLTAARRAAQRWPGGLFYAVRVGYSALGHIGGSIRKKVENR